MLSAAQAGDVDLLRQLLDSGHSINETNFDCVTPLHEACLAGRLECVQFLLLCGANVSLSKLSFEFCSHNILYIQISC